MNYKDITCETSDRIRTLTLNRPDKLNAFSRDMRESLIDAFADADRDDDVRVVIVTGAGRAAGVSENVSSPSPTVISENWT